MASVNVDAELVRHGGMLHQEEKMVELSNGCICCTLREDLLTSLSSLASEHRFDHVLVESSGISEPMPVAEVHMSKVGELTHIKAYQPPPHLHSAVRHSLSPSLSHPHRPSATVRNRRSPSGIRPLESALETLQAFTTL